jgi:hypothetical protein
MSFNKPVIIRDFQVGDIDFSGYDTTVTNDPEQSYQDQVEILAQRGGNDVPFTVAPVSPGKTTVTGNTIRANYVAAVKGDLAPTDPLGAVNINTASPVTSFSVHYTNGPDDAVEEGKHPQKPYSGTHRGVSGRVGLTGNPAHRIRDLRRPGFDRRHDLPG